MSLREITCSIDHQSVRVLANKLRLCDFDIESKKTHLQTSTGQSSLGSLNWFKTKHNKIKQNKNQGLTAHAGLELLAIGMPQGCWGLNSGLQDKQVLYHQLYL